MWGNFAPFLPAIISVMNNQEGFLVQHQSQAEKDQYLVDCFHDSGFLKQIIENDYSILAGRKGTGKTAIARYLEQKYEKNDLLTSKRISVTSFSDDKVDSQLSDVREQILLYILLATARHLFDKNFLLPGSRDYWEKVFEQAGINHANTYELFKTKNKTNSIKAGFAFFQGKLEEERVISDVNLNSESVFDSILESLDEIGRQTSFLFFVDDLSDYLDDSDKKVLSEDIHVIKEVILRLDAFNTVLQDSERGLRFVACIRDDLFDFMEGSNINKLRTNTLFLRWNEESFAGLIIRRLPHFRNNLEEALKDPKIALKKLFPDEIFAEKLSLFETNRYTTNFYAYLVAVSFNRPRDFLSFCYAMRTRLSEKHPATLENIDSAEGEYSDYFKNEIRDELYLASKIIDFDSDAQFLNKLIDAMSQRDNFNTHQLRTNVAPLLGVKTTTGRKKIENFIHQMWVYGIIGFKEKQDQLVNFKYIANNRELLDEKIEKYTFYLHRGLWWFARKRQDK